MSDEEQIHSEDEGEEEEEAGDSKMGPPEDSGPTEAELAMQRRRAQQESAASAGLDDTEELLEANRQERSKMEDEIQELRERSERRKKEREEEEKLVAEKRSEEEGRRKAEEEERRRKKDEDELKRREARAAKMAEFEKWSNPGQRNFVITKRAGGGEGEDDDNVSSSHGEGDGKDERKSREQLEAEKKAILGQRIQSLSTSGMDANKLAEKAKELHNQIYRLESERYDLEKRFKEQQYDMMELAERARQMIKVGKQGLKRVMLGEDDRDMIQENFAGAPSKIEMYSTYERQKDKRSYGERRTIFTGPQYGYPAERIAPQRIVGWNDVGLPMYTDVDGGELVEQVEEEVAEEE